MLISNVWQRCSEFKSLNRRETQRVVDSCTLTVLHTVSFKTVAYLHLQYYSFVPATQSVHSTFITHWDDELEPERKMRDKNQNIQVFVRVRWIISFYLLDFHFTSKKLYSFLAPSFLFIWIWLTSAFRFRPVNTQEKNARSPVVVETPATNNREVAVVEKSSLTKSFTFDRVFGTTSKQVDVYKVVAAPLVQEVLAGYNCTVFAYGQTGTGKTFTMEGERHEDISSSWENVTKFTWINSLLFSHQFSLCHSRIHFLELFPGLCLTCLMNLEFKK